MTGGAAEQRDGMLDASEAWERLRRIRSEADAEAAGLSRGTDGRRRWGCASPEADVLADRYLPLCLGGPRFAFAQLGQSLDGFIASRTGDADYVTGAEDRDHLHHLRALSDAVVIGDQRKFLSCLVMIDHETVAQFAQERNVPFTNFTSLCRAKDVQDLIWSEIERVNKQLARVETIKKFRLIEQLLTAEDEELTPTMKLKRSFVNRKYGELIDGMYREP